MSEYKKVITAWEDMRIVEVMDEDYNMADLKGDMFKPEHAREGLTVAQLRDEEVTFQLKVYDEGVYGYILEKWNPAVGHGWEWVDSCFGFIGLYCESSNCHYIVEEMRNGFKKL